MTENGSLEKMLMDVEKQVSDRTSIITAANAFLLQPFVMSFASVSGYLNAIPVIICLIGIGLNTFLGWSNWFQISKTKESWKKLTKSGGESPFSLAADTKDPRHYYVFNTYAPPLLILAWIACLFFFVLQKTISIN